MTVSGYSGTPLPRKLGISPGHRVLLSGRPGGFDPALLLPPAPVTVHRRAAGGRYDVVLLFCPDVATLRRALPDAMARTTTAGRCWVAWPKRASTVATDLSESAVRDAALAIGWVDVKVCAIDAVWSGLCLVRRRENR